MKTVRNGNYVTTFWDDGRITTNFEIQHGPIRRDEISNKPVKKRKRKTKKCQFCEGKGKRRRRGWECTSVDGPIITYDRCDTCKGTGKYEYWE